MWIAGYSLGISLSVFSTNKGKYEPGKTPYLDTFHAVYRLEFSILTSLFVSQL